MAYTYGGDETDPQSDMNIYLDGTAVDDGDATSGTYVSMEDTAVNVYVGGDNGSGWWEGEIAWIGIVGRGLTSAEVATLKALTNSHYGLSL